MYYDDESYNNGHGRAYEFLGISPKEGALIIVRPDQCRFFQTRVSFATTDSFVQMFPP